MLVKDNYFKASVLFTNKRSQAKVSTVYIFQYRQRIDNRCTPITIYRISNLLLGCESTPSMTHGAELLSSSCCLQTRPSSLLSGLVGPQFSDSLDGLVGPQFSDSLDGLRWT